MSTVLQTNIADFPLKARGKVRDIYELPDALLFIASDRISAFDYVLPNPIPDKGKVLTQISLFWFQHLKPRRQPPDYRRFQSISARTSKLPGTQRSIDDRQKSRDVSG